MTDIRVLVVLICLFGESCYNSAVGEKIVGQMEKRMVLYDIMADIRRELDGLSGRQIQALFKQAVPDARTVLVTYVSLRGRAAPMIFRYEGEGCKPDPYQKTVPDRVKSWVVDVSKVLELLPGTAWLLTWERLVEDPRSWQRVAQKYRLRQDQAKTIVRQAVFTLVYEMRDRGLPLAPHR